MLQLLFFAGTVSELLACVSCTDNILLEELGVCVTKGVDSVLVSNSMVTWAVPKVNAFAFGPKGKEGCLRKKTVSLDKTKIS